MILFLKINCGFNFTSNFSRKFSWTGRSLQKKNKTTKDGLILLASFQKGFKLYTPTKTTGDALTSPSQRGPAYRRHSGQTSSTAQKEDQQRIYQRSKTGGLKIPSCTVLHTNHMLKHSRKCKWQRLRPCESDASAIQVSWKVNVDTDVHYIKIQAFREVISVTLCRNIRAWRHCWGV